MENPTQFQRYEPCAFSSYKNRELKVKKKKGSRKKKESVLWNFHFVGSKFLGYTLIYRET